MPKTLNNKKGGIFINELEENPTPKDVFIDFLKNSKISYLTEGSSSIILKLEANEKYVSQYTNTDIKLFGEPVTSLLLKLSKIANGVDEVDIEYFNNEVNIQKDVFIKSVDYLQPICPAIVYSEIIEAEEFLKEDILLNRLKDSYTRNKNIKSFIKNILNQNSVSLGIIAMEYANDYKTIEKIFNDIKINKSKHMKNVYVYEIFKKRYSYYTIYIIILLAKYGYTHGDFHKGNILINKNYYGQDNQYNNVRPMFIDFGLARELENDEKEIINNFLNNDKYYEIIKYVCGIPSKDERVMGDRGQYYQLYEYICNYSDNEKVLININIKKIFENKKKQEIELYKKYLDNEIYKEFFKTFPLPLTDTYKKELFGYMLPEELSKPYQKLLPQGGRKMKKTQKTQKTQKNKITRKMRKTRKSRI